MEPTFPPAAEAPTGSLQAQFEHATAQVAFWQAMLVRIRGDKRRLGWLVPVGSVVAVVAGLVARDPRVGGGTFAVALTSWLMGLYFTRVRETEYLYNLAEAEQDLARARGAASSQPAQGN